MAKKLTVHIFSEVGGTYAKDGLIGMLSNKRPDVDFKDIKLDETGNNFKSQSDRDEIQAATILLTDPGLIARLKLAQGLPNLKWMQSTWAGVDSLVKSLDHKKPLPSYQLTRFAGVFGSHMAEYVVGHIISRERKFQEMKARQMERKWATKDFDHYRLLSDLRLGILGCGDIGGEIAKAAKVFGMQVWGIGRRDLPKERRPPHVDRYMLIPQLSEMLENCDYVCNVLPSTPETRGLLSGDVLSKCENKKSVFINVGRGDVIDEGSLMKALSSGWISHAILDVFKEEPLSDDSALWLHPNVTISPHVSAVSLPRQVAEVFLDNFDRYMTDKPLKFVVDFDKGY